MNNLKIRWFLSGFTLVLTALILFGCAGGGIEDQKDTDPSDDQEDVVPDIFEETQADVGDVDLPESVEEVCTGPECPVQMCEPGYSLCGGSHSMRVCRNDGGGFDVIDCAPGEECSQGACQGLTCSPDSRSCEDDTTLNICNRTGSAWESISCGEGRVCLDDECRESLCSPGIRDCADSFTVRICNSVGSGYDDEPCSENQNCDGGECIGNACVPGLRRCQSNIAQECNDRGSAWINTDCGGEAQCVEGVCEGGGVCLQEMIQMPGYRIYKYEASRSDSTSASEGTSLSRTCSRAGVLPWTNVSYSQASAACSLTSLRPCTLDEWQQACFGPIQTSYPYGETYDASLCNTESGQTEPVGIFSDCRSDAGAFDMSGNVAEWVSTGTGGRKHIMGGAYSSGLDELSCTYDLIQASLSETRDSVGFRCCSDQ